MTGRQLGKARKQKGWNQQQAATRLGVSQPYLSLLENGQRRLTRRLVARATRVFGLPLTTLPLNPVSSQLSTLQQVAEQLSALGYPGFAYMGARRKRNPAEVLVAALKQDQLEARLVEALPWVLLNCPDLDWRWLTAQVRLHNLQNRLGFLVALARRKLEEEGEVMKRRYRDLRSVEQELERSRLVLEDAFSQKTVGERRWLRDHRPELAAHWNLLTDLSLEHLPHSL